jgi:hypothetical protein
MTEPAHPDNDNDPASDRPPLTPEAQRALAEAAARRERAEAAAAESQPEEFGGRGGLDPIRYGDWEKAGLTSDF